MYNIYLLIASLLFDIVIVCFFNNLLVAVVVAVYLSSTYHSFSFNCPTLWCVRLCNRKKYSDEEICRNDLRGRAPSYKYKCGISVSIQLKSKENNKNEKKNEISCYRCFFFFFNFFLSRTVTQFSSFECFVHSVCHEECIRLH